MSRFLWQTTAALRSSQTTFRRHSLWQVVKYPSLSSIRTAAYTKQPLQTFRNLNPINTHTLLRKTPFVLNISKTFRSYASLEQSVASHRPEKSVEDTALRWKETAPFSLSAYRDLSKARLAMLVVLTTMCGYAMAPGVASASTLLWTTLGTGLCVGCANTINQWIESPYDSQMSRTKNRVLVRRAIAPAHAFMAGISSGVMGVTILSFVNPITAALGFANIILYTCVYTPMKRTSIANTWVGSIVGAIPPIMGWAACSASLEPGAWLLGFVLYAWQFPHFNALSWNLREDYAKAGYRMMSVVNPSLNSEVALRYSALLFPACWAATWMDLTSFWFLVDSTVVNALMLIPALKFWKNSNEKTARALFFSSLLHLPALFALFMIHKVYL